MTTATIPAEIRALNEALLATFETQSEPGGLDWGTELQHSPYYDEDATEDLDSGDPSDFVARAEDGSLWLFAAIERGWEISPM